MKAGRYSSEDLRNQKLPLSGRRQREACIKNTLGAQSSSGFAEPERIHAHVG